MGEDLNADNLSVGREGGHHQDLAAVARCGMLYYISRAAFSFGNSRYIILFKKLAIYLDLFIFLFLGEKLAHTLSFFLGSRCCNNIFCQGINSRKSGSAYKCDGG